MTAKKNSITMQRFIKTILLIIQILMIICFVCALADPHLKNSIARIDNNVILIIDISASMDVPCNGNTRLYDAKRRAYEVVSRPATGNTMAVIRAGSFPRLSVPFTNDREKIKKGIMNSSVTAEPGNMQKALDMAVSLLAGKTTDEIIILSDGAFTLSNTYPEKRIRYLLTEDTGPLPANLAITEFQIRPENNTKRTFEVLITLRNYNAGAAKTILRVYAAPVENIQPVINDDDKKESLFYRECEVEPFGEESFVFSALLPEQTILKGEIDSPDALKADNSAWAVVPGEKGLRILLVTTENFFLESAIRSIPDIVLSRTPEISYNQLTEAAEEFDIIIFDRITPPGLVKGAYILIQSFPPDIPLVKEGEISPGPVVRLNREHPVMKSVSLVNTRIQKAMKIVPGKNMEVLFKTADTPAAAGYDSGQLRAVCFFFDFLKSDILLKPSFPILIRNSVEWLTGRRNTPRLEKIHTGDIYRVTASPWIETLSITTPGGSSMTYGNIRFPFLYNHTEEPGIYEIKGEGYKEYFAVNLTNSNESDIHNRFTGIMGTEQQFSSAGEKNMVLESLRHYFIIICILLLAVEWILWKRAREQEHI